MTRSRSPRFTRIVVGFDSADEPQPLLQSVTVLARATRARVVGLFVEETNMMALADLPIVRFVQVGGGSSTTLNADRMRSALARQAAACEAALSRVAEQARLEWSFSRSRGSLREQITEQAEQGDLLVVRADPYNDQAALQALDLARQACHRASGVMVIPRLARAIRGPVALVTAGDANPLAAVALAAQVAQERREPLTVVLAAPNADMLKSIEDELRQFEFRGRVMVQRLVSPRVSQVAALLREIGPSLITANLHGGLFDDDQVALGMIKAAAAPVILLGNNGSDEARQG